MSYISFLTRGQSSKDYIKWIDRWQSSVSWHWENDYLGQNNSGNRRDQPSQLCLLQTQINALSLSELQLLLEKKYYKYSVEAGPLRCVWVLCTALGGVVNFGQCLLMDDSIALVRPHHQRSRFFNKLLKAFVPKEETKENQMTIISNCKMFWLSNFNRNILCNGEAGWCQFHILFFGVWTKPALPVSWQVETTPCSKGTREHSTIHNVPALPRERTTFTMKRALIHHQ